MLRSNSTSDLRIKVRANPARVAFTQLRGTVRTIRGEVRETLSRRLAEVAEGVGATFGATVTTEYIFGAPSIVNDPEIVELVRAAATQVVGAENVHESKVGMGGEEGVLFRKVLGWSIALVLIMCVLVTLQNSPLLDWMVVGK